MAQDRRVGDVEDRQPAGGEFEAERVARDEAQAQSRDHRLLDRVVAAHLHADRRTLRVRGEEFLHRRTRSRSGLARDQRLGRQFVDADAAPGSERMRGAGDEHQRVRRQHRRLDVEVGRRPAHDGEVDRVAGEQAMHGFAVVDQEAQADFRVDRAELRQERRREVLGGAHRGDGNATAATQCGQRLVGFVERALDAGDLFDQHFAGLGEEDALADAFEQLAAGDFLELPDLQRDRRLREVQFLGGAREGQPPGGDGEDLQLAQGGVTKARVAHGGPFRQVPERRAAPAGAAKKDLRPTRTRVALDLTRSATPAWRGTEGR